MKKNKLKTPIHTTAPLPTYCQVMLFFFFWRRISDLAFHTQIPKGKISGCTGLLML